MLILTAFSQHDLVEQARDAGALAYLVKPFQKSDLIPAIEMSLGRFEQIVALEHENANLAERLEARKLIDRAKGRLMDEHGMSEAGVVAVPPEDRDGLAAEDPRDRARRRSTARSHRERRRSLQPVSAPATARTMPPMAKLLLLDGHSLAYRAFFALPTDLATKAGTVTNAVYGFTSMLTKVLTDEQPDYIAVAFDAPGGSTYRYELDADYKAGRKETPDLFGSQLPLIHEVLEALEIRQLEVSGVEADDVIATLATRAADAGIDVVVVTGDRDSFQLVRDPHVKVLYNKRGVSDYALYDEAGIAERYLGVTPRAVHRLRGAARRHQRQPARRSRHRREDRGEAHHHVRRPRRHLRAPRRAAAEAEDEPR